MCNRMSCAELAISRAGMGRRDFIRLAAIGAGAALFMSVAPKARAGGHAKALLLSCMDYRLVDDLVLFMHAKGLKDDYDHVVLAGASLGVVSETFADWHKTFWEHLDVAIELHHVEEVIVIDHRDCGAYTIALGGDAVATPEQENAVHAATLAAFAAQVHGRHPDLKIETFLMSLDGKVEAVAV
jgi:carbonic anhydrase